jgi:hypothetical protein
MLTYMPLEARICGMDPKYHRILMVHNKEKTNKSSSKTFSSDTFERLIVTGLKRNTDESAGINLSPNEDEKSRRHKDHKIESKRGLDIKQEESGQSEKDRRNEKEEKQHRRQKYMKEHEKKKKKSRRK